MTKFCVGCALTFWGVWLISSRREGRVEEEDGDGGEEIGFGEVPVKGGVAGPVVTRGEVVALDGEVGRPQSRVGEEGRRGSVGRRRSMGGLLPGPIVAGYQLKAVAGEFGRVRGDVEAGLEEALQEREGGEGRRRSGSLGMVLDLLKRRGRRGLGEMEDGEEEE